MLTIFEMNHYGDNTCGFLRGYIDRQFQPQDGTIL